MDLNVSQIITEVVVLICGGFCSYITYKLKKYTEQKEQEQRKIIEKQNIENEQKEKERKSVLDVLSDLTIRLQRLESLIQKQQEVISGLIKDIENHKQVSMTVIRDRLMQAFRYFIEVEKAAPTHAREDINSLVEAYESLLGNSSFIHDIYEQFKNLPIEKHPEKA